MVCVKDDMHSSVGGNATARNIDEEVTSSETTIMYMSSLLLEMAPGVILALASVLVDAVTTTNTRQKIQTDTNCCKAILFVDVFALL